MGYTRPPTPKPPICRLSDPAHRHKLCRRKRRSDGPISICFTCKGRHLKNSNLYYYCAICNVEFHRGCHLFPPEIRHPFHPSHPLTLISLKPRFSIYEIARNWYGELDRHNEYGDDDDDDDEDKKPGEDDNDCDDDDEEEEDDHNEEDSNDDDDSDDDDSDDDVDDNDYDDDDDDDEEEEEEEEEEDDDEDDDDQNEDVGDDDDDDKNHGKCKCCRDRLGKAYYHCSICKFNLDMYCAIRPPPPSITRLKSHEHTLTLFPVRLPLPCDACGFSLDNTKDSVYTCLPCSHMVHRSCIYLPRVIQITRHPHRLSLTSSLPPGDFSCGVCRQTVDVNYGQYSCNKRCHYAVHSKCATRDDVWDGEDLEGVPEDPEEDIEPFLRIDEETIKHFSHEHYLKLQEKTSICEKDKFCEACTLPLKISQRFYGCMQCDFVLDEACASLPLKKYHPIHKHPLTLHPVPIDEVMGIGPSTYTKGMFMCDACRRVSCGFMYKCGVKYCNFQIDAMCASLPDPLSHGCHPHDLFFNLTRGNCMGCGSDRCSSYFLECLKSDSFLGIKCASLPCEAHYKHDRHPLTLCYGEEDTKSSQYWCEKCESKLNPRTWFYTCDSCRITLHVNCLLGKDMYMKPHYIFNIGLVNDDDQVEVALYDGNSRLLCSNCGLRCAQTLVFKRRGEYESFCTIKCVGNFFYEETCRAYAAWKSQAGNG